MIKVTSSTGKKRIAVQGTELTLSNLDKILWPDDGITKGDLINFYTLIFPYLAPHLESRPLVVTRYPHGIKDKWFYQKNAPQETPDWIQLFPRYSSHSRRTINFIICDRLATMVWLANQACIELHPWMSRTDKPDHPDYFVFDLDPSKGTGFQDVCEVARVLRKILQHLGLQMYLKTSGATGLHLMVPVIRRYTYKELRDFARQVAEMAVALIPEKATVERRVNQRQGKVYVDYLQNYPGKTVCSVFSIRPLSGAPVSTPISWEELDSVRPLDFNIFSVPNRLAKQKKDWLTPIPSQTLSQAWQILKNHTPTPVQ